MDANVPSVAGHAQVVVRVRPVLPHELSDEVAVTCSQDARRLQVQPCYRGLCWVCSCRDLAKVARRREGQCHGKGTPPCPTPSMCTPSPHACPGPTAELYLNFLLIARISFTVTHHKCPTTVLEPVGLKVISTLVAATLQDTKHTCWCPQVLLPDRFSGGATLLPGATRSGARSYEFDACLNGGTSQVCRGPGRQPTQAGF